MKHFLTVAALLLATLPANAILWKYGDYNSSKKQCTLTGWGGTQPSSGKLAIPASYKHTDGVTYKITAIAPHALDNLTTVTEITIPASVTQIGDAKTNHYPSDPQNFSNCPALQKFAVESGSKYFSAIDNMLYVDGKYLLSVPQALAVSNGALALPSVTSYMSPCAFAGNTTVTTLTIPRQCNISGNGGLNRAKAIKTYKLSGQGDAIKLVSGMLMDWYDRLVSYPPAKSATKATVPSAASQILEYAFANTEGLKAIDLSAVSKIGKSAFEGCGLTKVVIPGTVTEIGEGTFKNSKSLTSVHLECLNIELPEHFAYGCSALTRVTTENPIDVISDAAFKNCKSLTEFPFSGYTDASSDSIFFGCGFTKVVFSDDAIGERTLGEHMFSGCSQLEEIDASAVVTKRRSLNLPPNFAIGCNKLKSLKLPASASFSQIKSSTEPIFGYTCALTHIEMQSIWTSDDKYKFCYSTTMSGGSEYTPEVYIKVTANRDLYPDSYNEWPIGPMFAAGNGATVRPQIFCDSYTPSENYVCKTATYNIPGATADNYIEAENAGCTVRETYGVEFQKLNGHMRVVISRKANAPADIREFNVSFDGASPKRIGMEGSVISDTSYDNIREIRISYLLNGIAMATDYPMAHWTEASVDGITVDTSDISLEGRTLHGGAGCTAIAVYSASGRMMLEQKGPDAALDALTAGIYIASVTYANGNTRNFKFTLN